MSQSSPNLNPIQLAIVSPCSQCKNQSGEDKTGYPPCPRRQIQKCKADLDAQGQSTQHLEHLALTGLEATLKTGVTPPASDNNDLRNPVYWNEGHAILVWVATLADNGGVRAPDGTLVTPSVLDPAFDTTYIQCHALPVVPALAEAPYFANGAFNEGDHVEVRFSANQQLDVNAETSEMVLVDGFAQKVHFAFSVPRQVLAKDHVPAGI